MSADLKLDDLGPGWEETACALAALQADLSRTVTEAPTLVLLWREAEEDSERALADKLGSRWAYIGKGAHWYYGADGGFELPRGYAEAVEEIADELADAIADTLLGYYAYWPHRPTDDHPLSARQDADQKCWWICDRGGHTVAEVGQLPSKNG